MRAPCEVCNTSFNVCDCSTNKGNNTELPCKRFCSLTCYEKWLESQRKAKYEGTQ